ncbi:MAG: hypothetical protein LCH63_20025 [Candidatus Melainabacteria bacterium]|nr:hypothetical protein [Candidatus Melainabacteria bacterium]
MGLLGRIFRGGCRGSHQEYQGNDCQDATNNCQPNFQPQAYGCDGRVANNRQNQCRELDFGCQPSIYRGQEHSIRSSSSCDQAYGKRSSLDCNSGRVEHSQIVKGEVAPQTNWNQNNFAEAANQAAREGKPLVIVVGSEKNPETAAHLSKAWSMQNGHYEVQNRPDTRKYYKDEAVFVRVDPEKVKPGTVIDDLLQREKLQSGDAATIIATAGGTNSKNDTGKNGAELLTTKAHFGEPTDPFKLISAHESARNGLRPSEAKFEDNAKFENKPPSEIAPQRENQISPRDVEDLYPDSRNEIPKVNPEITPPIRDLRDLYPDSRNEIPQINPETNPEKTPQARDIEDLYPDSRNSAPTPLRRRGYEEELPPEVKSESPAKPIEVPGDALSETPQAPVETPQAPVETPQAPVETPQAPVETPQAPVETPQAPVETPQAPVETPQAHLGPIDQAPAQLEEAQRQRETARGEVSPRMLLEQAAQLNSMRMESFDHFFKSETLRNDKAGRSIEDVQASDAGARNLLTVPEYNLLDFNKFKAEIDNQYSIFSSRDTILKGENGVADKRDAQFEALRNSAKSEGSDYRNKQVLLAQMAKGLHLPAKEGEKVSYYAEYRMENGNQIVSPRESWQESAAQTLADIAADPNKDHSVVARVLPEILNNPFIPATVRIKALAGMTALAGDKTSNYMDNRTSAEKQINDPTQVLGTPREVTIAAIVKAMQRDSNHFSVKPSIEFQKAALDSLLMLKAGESAMQLQMLAKSTTSQELRELYSQYIKLIGQASLQESMENLKKHQ